MHKNIFQFIIFLIPFLIFSQSEYKYEILYYDNEGYNDQKI